ncbi:MAG: radical SAM peptide maturase, CXXX-repeat target family [Clostridia bacterium]|nr:radical SAM peptide maturase, CXXX-repeat target family [Clostridia bacterium]
METSGYKVGKTIPSWKEGNAQTITFVVTEDCNLRCKYCYITHKVSNKKMRLEDAKKFIDYVLTADIKRTEAVIIEFIGGEPLIEVELIDQISDYFKIKAFELGHDWFWNYRFSICTNGVNYSNADVQRYLKKNEGKMSVSMTIDGTREKHNLQRVFPDGTGSYDAIAKNIELWKTQFPGSTKVTFASADLPLLKDSILDLWDKGVTDVAANVVFEDVWEEGDDRVFEKQLMDLADVILDRHLFDKYVCTLFDETLGGYLGEEQLRQTSCGAGKMMALGTDGKIYPCIRYIPYSLNHEEEWCIGNIDSGIDMERVRPFMTTMTKYQSDAECLSCEIANGCRFCQGFNYDESGTATNFYRAKYICNMHKARVRANDYYFAKLFNRYGIRRESDGSERKRLYFLLADDYVNYCSCSNPVHRHGKMTEEEILEGLQFAHENFFDAIFVHSRSEFAFADRPEYEGYLILHLVPAKFYKEASALHQYLLVFDETSYDLPVDGIENCILNVHANDIAHLSAYVSTLLKRVSRINLNVMDIDRTFDEKTYREQLAQIKDELVKMYMEQGIVKEVSIITDICHQEVHAGCQAGDRSFVYAPDHRFYTCSSMYSRDQGAALGNIQDGLSAPKNANLYKLDHMPLCQLCDAYHCSRCIQINRNATKEVNVPPSYQCRKSLIEREIARQYQADMDGMKGKHILHKLDYADPMTPFYEENHIAIGYYQFNGNISK